MPYARLKEFSIVEMSILHKLINSIELKYKFSMFSKKLDKQFPSFIWKNEIRKHRQRNIDKHIHFEQGQG